MVESRVAVLDCVLWATAVSLTTIVRMSPTAWALWSANMPACEPLELDGQRESARAAGTAARMRAMRLELDFDMVLVGYHRAEILLRVRVAHRDGVARHAALKGQHLHADLQLAVGRG